MNPIDAKYNFYAEYNVDFNAKDPKFKKGDHVKISKQKNIFAKGYAPNWSEEVFVISKIKNIVLWTYIINDLNGEHIVGTFYKKNCRRQIKKNLEQKKQLKEKEIKYMLNGNAIIINSMAGLIKKTFIK